MICKNCGAEIRDSAKFCESCGSRIEPAAERVEETADETVVESVTEEAEESVEEEVERPYAEIVDDTEDTGAQWDDSPAPGGMIGFSIASLVLGILSICCCCAWTISLVFAVVAIVLGIIALVKNYSGKGMAIAGIIVAVVGVLIALIALLTSTVLSSAFENIRYGILDLMNELSY